MAETIKLLKGLKANLPSSGATPGAMYCCTDTGGIYIANSSGVPQLIANIDTGATSTGSNGSGNAVTSLSYNTSTRKLTYNLGNSFLPLAGGTITGKIDLTTAPNANDDQKMGKTSGASGGIHFRKKGTNDEGNAITWSYAENNEAHAGIYVKSSGSYGTKMYLATTNSFNDGAKAALEIDHTGAIKALRSNFVGNLTGNASTATKFAAAQTIALTGDVTGNASSQAGWSVTTTLKNSGVTAGSYGPSKSVSPEHGKGFEVPYFTVDAKGRVTAASTKTITLPTYTIGNATITIAAGSGLKTGGSFTTNQTSASTVTLDVNPGIGITVTDDKVSLAASGVTAGSYGPSAAVTGSNNTTLSVPYITVDAYGRVTNISNKTYTSVNTDVNVKQTASTTSNYRALLMGTSHNATPSNLGTEETGQTYKSTNIVACPSTGEIKATKFTGALSGNATSATKATQDGSGNVITSTYATKTSLATVATSGAYSDLSGKPTSLPASDVYSWAKASSKPSYSWSEITGKPSTFTPADHTHKYAGSSSAGGAATTALACTGNAATATNVAWSGVTSKPSYYDAKAIKGITRDGTTFTYTCMDGTTGTFTQQDNNTTYSAGNGLTLSGTTFNVGAGTGISVAADTISLATVGTAGTYGPTTNVTGNNNATIKVPQITTDAYGRVTSVTERIYTSVNTQNAGTITGVSANGTSVATSGVANIPAASTSTYGVTKLTSATDSTSTTLAATASAVKAAYDLANSKAPGYTYGTTDLTAGVSELATGTLYFVYE